MPTNGASPHYLTIPEGAKRLGISRDTLFRWISQGKVAAIQPAGPRHRVWVDERDLLRSERRGEVGR
jgi:excisionase family DNA binding protein